MNNIINNINNNLHPGVLKAIETIKHAYLLNGTWQTSKNTFIALSHQARFLENNINNINNINSEKTSTTSTSIFDTIPIANLNEVEVETLITAAQNAGAAWAETTAFERAKYLHAWADLLKTHATDLAKILTSEQGKPLSEAMTEINYSIELINWFANQGTQIQAPQLMPYQNNQQVQTAYQALGVVLAVTPWNFPASMIARKVAAALAAGCTVLLKPSETTPLIAAILVYFANLVLPKSVLQIVSLDALQTPIILKKLCEDQRIAKISLTGSTAVGRIIMQQSASSLKRLSLELGGAAFAIIDHIDYIDNIDNINFKNNIKNNIKNIVKKIIDNKTRNAGQTCVSINTILLPAAIETPFADALLIELKNIELKNIELQNQPQALAKLVSPKALNRTVDLLNDAINKGAKVYSPQSINNLQTTKCMQLTQKDLQDLLNQPDIVAYQTGQCPAFIVQNTSPDMLVCQQEIFAPIYVLKTYTDFKDAINIANQSEYGLAAYVFSQNYAHIQYAQKHLAVGMVSINAAHFSNVNFPFVGIKQSGFGVECSVFGVYEYLQLKSISQNLNFEFFDK